MNLAPTEEVFTKHKSTGVANGAVRVIWPLLRHVPWSRPLTPNAAGVVRWAGSKINLAPTEEAFTKREPTDVVNGDLSVTWPARNAVPVTQPKTGKPQL